MRADPSRDSTILVVGATSALAQALCHVFATPRTRFILAARDSAELLRCADDLRLRHGCQVSCHPFEACDFERHPGYVESWCQESGAPPDGVLVCHGYLPPAETSMTRPDEARRTLDVNFSSVVSILTPLADRMAARGSGWIVGIGSVAGDRGRQSNYVYGAAKAALAVYLQGLRNRLAARGVHVMTVKPGPMDTRMLWSLGQGRPRLVTAPRRVASDIHRALGRARDVVYSPWYWRLVMVCIAMIPERVFKRMRL